MIRGPLSTFAATLAAFTVAAASPAGSLPSTDRFWPQWRGPLGTGEAPRANPPLEWSEEKNVRWKVEVPGRGKSSPIVWGDLVFVTTAVPTGKDSAQEFVVLAFGRANGQVTSTGSRRTDPRHSSIQ